MDQVQVQPQNVMSGPNGCGGAVDAAAAATSIGRNEFVTTSLFTLEPESDA
ncbi:hypothetical protein A2U01_0055491, partial [Trifolium medium]|nr:hypothetical protein [Trifolium medium]